MTAQTQCTTLIDFLLENGSKPNVCVKLNTEILSGDTPMTIAYHHKKDLYQELPNKSLECTEVVKKKFVLTKPNFKDTLYKTVKSFIRFKACPYITNSSGTSVLLKASASMDSRNLVQICNVKPSKGGDVNTKNDKEETSLMMAVNSLETVIKLKEKKPNVEIIKYLLKANADPNIRYENGDTVLMKIIKTMDITLLETLLENAVIAIDHNIKNKSKFFF
ncbi:hypothetical protein HPULCUR_002648 [Helicostylum pulchrum]|uniref:Ankyrin repeat protein n=1 Tax=Helicostylum pulchrum TaxID=562976 RepID=A0ABP9XS70_9FUNG